MGQQLSLFDDFGSGSAPVSPPLLGEGKRWNVPETGLLVGALLRGDLGEAVGILRRLNGDGLARVLLEAGFTVTGRGHEVMRFVQGDLVEAARLKVDGFGLREGREAAAREMDLGDVNAASDASLDREAIDADGGRVEQGLVEKGQVDGEMAVQEVTQGMNGRIDDFGEKLGGAKKDRDWSFGREISESDLARLPLSKIWPGDEADGIENVFAAAVAVTARASVPPKPRVSYKVDRWVKQVQVVRGLAQRVVSGEVTEAVFKEKLAEASGLRDFRAKVLLLEQLDRAQWGRIGKVEEFPDAYTYLEGAKFPSPFVMVEVDGKSRRFDGCRVVLDALERIKPLVQVETAERRMEFEVRGRGESFSINKKGDREYRKLKTFSTAKEAFAFIADHHEQLVAEWGKVKERDNVGKGDVRGDENRPRTGRDWRAGKDVTPEQFIEEFGFRGVEFGNWVSQGKGHQERQGMLNQAYEALMDLSAIVGIPPKAISLNGSLGLAFGSRGSGNASAHFEPGNLVINLTKTRGAGTLAHEWFHALDNYFARERGGEVPMDRGLNAQQTYRQNNYITYRPEPLMVHVSGRSSMTAERLEQNQRNNPASGFFAPGNWKRDPRHPAGVRPEMEALFVGLVQSLDRSPMANRSRMNDKDADGYWGRIIERAARGFENFVIASMDERGYQNDYLTNVRPASDFRRSIDRYPYLLPEEVAPVKAAFGELFAGMKTRETEKGIALFSMGLNGGDRPIGEVHSVDSLMGEMDKRMGQPGLMAALIATGRVSVVDSGSLDAMAGSGARELNGEDGASVWSADGKRPLGMVLNGHVYLVADHVEKSTDVKGLLLHELGVHALKLGKSDQEFEAILEQFDALREKGDVRVIAAFDRVPMGTPESVRREEALGYFVEGNPQLPLSKQVVSWFKAQIERLAEVLPALKKSVIGQWAKGLSGDDLVYMATSATRRGGELLGREAVAREVGSGNGFSGIDRRGMADGEVEQGSKARGSGWRGGR